MYYDIIKCESKSMCPLQVVVSTLQEPREECSLSPAEQCGLQTRLVPRLEPVTSCEEVTSPVQYSTVQSSTVQSSTVME